MARGKAISIWAEDAGCCDLPARMARLEGNAYKPRMPSTPVITPCPTPRCLLRPAPNFSVPLIFAADHESLFGRSKGLESWRAGKLNSVLKKLKSEPIPRVAQFFSVHPDNPQLRLIRQAAAIVKEGGVIAYPTDSCYALGGQLGNKEIMTRMRVIRQLDEQHHFTLMCRDLTQLSHYAKFDNFQYRLLKATTPGCYTFIFQATREVPRRLQLQNATPSVSELPIIR